LPEGVLLRFSSRESVDWLMPTIRAISFLAVFLFSNAKICDLSSEVSGVFHRLEPMENRWIFLHFDFESAYLLLLSGKSFSDDKNKAEILLEVFILFCYSTCCKKTSNLSKSTHFTGLRVYS